MSKWLERSRRGARVRNVSVKLKEGHRIPGRFCQRFTNEGTGWEEAWWRREAPMLWKRSDRDTVETILYAKEDAWWETHSSS